MALKKYTYKFFLAVLCHVLIPGSSFAGGFIESFDDSGYRDRWDIANFDQGGPKFLTSWRRKQVSVELKSVETFGGGQLLMDLQPAQDGAEKPYKGAQLWRGKENHYGSYEIVMNAAAVPGVVSAFFIYTGPFFKDPHDEIDVEFLGKDTTKIWINAFADGKSQADQWIDLGFDAATTKAVYRFDWLPDYITWYVNDKEIYRLTSKTHDLPSHAGRAYLSMWAANKGQADWAGELPAEDVVAQMSVSCVSYRPPNDPGLTCSEYFKDER